MLNVQALLSRYISRFYGKRKREAFTSKRLELTTVPMQVNAGDAISRWARYGVPVDLGAAAVSARR